MRTTQAETGFDWADLREELLGNSDRHVIKHQEFDGLDREDGARPDEDINYRRSLVESDFPVLKLRYSELLTARSWYGHFRKLTLKAAVKYLDRGLGTSHH